MNLNNCKKFLALGAVAVSLSLGMGAAQAATPGVDPAVKNELNTKADAEAGSVAYRMFKKMDSVATGSTECAPAASALQQDYRDYLTMGNQEVAGSLKADGVNLKDASAEQINAKVNTIASIGDRILKLRSDAETLNTCMKAKM